MTNLGYFLLANWCFSAHGEANLIGCIEHCTPSVSNSFLKQTGVLS